MADIVSKKTRSRMMSGIRGKNTKPELLIRKAIFNRGYRYRLHTKELPGKPDIVFPKFRAVIFVHGCFWHLHECHLFKWPSTRPEFWKDKLEGNRERDRRKQKAIAELGWRILVVWECALKGKGKLDLNTITDRVETFLNSDILSAEITGRTP